MKTHRMKLREQPFEAIRSGRKTFELRLYDEKRRLVAIGDRIVFTCEGESLTVRVTALHRFESFAALYAALSPEACGYTKETAASADPRDMEQYYSPDEQRKYGVIGIGIERIPEGAID